MNWPFNRLNLVLLAAMVFLTIAGFWFIPPDRPVPMHWNWHGVADSWWPRSRALLLVPLVAGAIVILCWVLARAGLQIARGGGGRRHAVVVSCVFVVLLVVQLIVVLAGSGHSVTPIRAITFVVALAFLAIGNVLPKVGPSEPRFSWLQSLRIVRERGAQRLMGGLMMVSGSCLLIASVLDAPPPLLVAAVLLAVAAPIVAGIAYAILRPRFRNS